MPTNGNAGAALAAYAARAGIEAVVICPAETPHTTSPKLRPMAQRSMSLTARSMNAARWWARAPRKGCGLIARL